MLDLNSDLAEGAGTDEALLEWITSANICCGAHAGSIATIEQTLALCAQHGTTIGAHPGYPDREHFGRRELPYESERVYAMVSEQVVLLVQQAERFSLAVRYIKPHGGLYHLVNRDATYAEAVVRVAEQHGMAVMGLPQSVAARVSIGRVRYLAEGFADRRYYPDGTLVPRTEANAVLTDPDEAVEQALRLLQTMSIDSLCVHGDTPHAFAFVKRIHEAFALHQIPLRSVL